MGGKCFSFAGTRDKEGDNPITTKFKNIRKFREVLGEYNFKLSKVYFDPIVIISVQFQRELKLDL